jgi:hypothetical protein
MIKWSFGIKWSYGPCTDKENGHARRLLILRCQRPRYFRCFGEGTALISATSVGTRIDIVSDTICPWCYIGKRRLEHALTTLTEEGLTFQVH